MAENNIFNGGDLPAGFEALVETQRLDLERVANARLASEVLAKRQQNERYLGETRASQTRENNAKGLSRLCVNIARSAMNAGVQQDMLSRWPLGNMSITTGWILRADEEHGVYNSGGIPETYYHHLLGDVLTKRGSLIRVKASIPGKYLSSVDDKLVQQRLMRKGVRTKYNPNGASQDTTRYTNLLARFVAKHGLEL